MSDKNKPITRHVLIDSATLKVTRDDILFDLEPQSLRLLLYFVENQNEVISRAQLSESVWQSPYTSDDAINRGISTIRKVLSEHRNQFIRTIPKIGYTFSIPEDVIVELQDTAPLAIENNANSLAQIQPTQAQSAQAALVDDAVTVQSVALPPVVIPPTLQPPIRRNWIYFLSTLAIVVIAIFAWFQLTNTSNKVPLQANNQTPHQQANKPIKLAFAAFDVQPRDQAAEQNNSIEADSLRHSILGELAQDEHFELVDKIHAQYSQSASNSSPDKQLSAKLWFSHQKISLALQLNDSLTNNAHFIKVIEAPIKDPTAAYNSIKNQAVAAIKLTLLHQTRLKRYSNALEQLNYVDMAKLVQASLHFGNVTPNSTQNALATLLSLYQKYPANAQIIGLLSRVKSRENFQTMNQQTDNSSYLQLANKALTLEPSNLDALLTLFYYNIKLSHKRVTINTLISSMMRYHGNSQSTWRAVLFSQIALARPCEEIKSTIESMPTGVFKPHRITAIMQILESCLAVDSNQILDQLWQQSQLSDDQSKRAIYRNFRLFDVRFDTQGETFKRIEFREHNDQLVNLYHYFLMIGDVDSAKAIGANINDSVNGFWYWFAHALATINNQTGLETKSRVEEQLNNYSVLSKTGNFRTNIELYYAIYLTKKVQQGQQPQQIAQYLNQKAKFPISPSTRYETTALFLLQYAAGQFQQSQQTARKLFSVLELYRRQFEASYQFWRFGHLQFIASYYCGDDCQVDLPSNDIKDLPYFADNSIWWPNDLAATKIILQPWQNETVVKLYLAKTAQDIQRLQRKLGLDLQ